jgi:hypothetical protein
VLRFLVLFVEFAPDRAVHLRNLSHADTVAKRNLALAADFHGNDFPITGT